MRLGIFGGTFDPPHLAHLALAQCAADQLSLDSVIFIPNFLSPFKSSIESANGSATPYAAHVSAEMRCEMVDLAIVGNKKFRVDNTEATAQTTSFSVDTVLRLRAQFPEATLYFVMGADAFRDFPSWKNPETIVREATVAVARRPNVEVETESHPFAQATVWFEMPLMEISSSLVRRYIREGKSIQYLVPWTVHTFIDAHSLYR